MKRYSKVKYSKNKSQKHIYYTSWKDYVSDIQEGVIGNKPRSIFRGQSNFEPNASKIWDIRSSFNRTYKNENFLKNMI